MEIGLKHPLRTRRGKSFFSDPIVTVASIRTGGSFLATMRSAKFLFALSALALTHAVPAAAQNPLDRGDPGIIEEEFERQLPREQADDVTLPVAETDRISTCLLYTSDAADD